MIIHIVKAGESLYQIAKRHGVSANRIIEDNGISDSSRLVVGQALIIRKETQQYIVQPGDSIYGIAERFGISVEQLLEANDLGYDAIIYPGDAIDIVYDNLDKIPMEINGYIYPNIELDILRRYLPYLTYLSVFSYQVRADGSLSTLNEESLISEAYRYNVAPLMVITNIERPGEFSSDLMHTLLTDETKQSALIENIINTMNRKGYYGVDFDFEYLYPEDREPYNNFIRKATERFHARGFTVSSALAPKLRADQPGLLYEAHDYRAHGAILDHVIIMTYEWGYLYSEAMPVAPINMVEKVIEYAITEIPNEKILMGVPNYGYDFFVPRIEGRPARLLTNLEAVDLAGTVNAAIRFNEIAQSPYFNYYSDNQQHQVHFEDARSIESKIKLAADYNLGGLSIWTLMSYFPQLTVLIDYYLEVIKVVGE
ncbi:MAG: LysM peptidoglycan-binding domain-containing protein [Bacilli bacterium]|nr:LysM peptidoglycan-binding domain-containing protein [Bacilli bacterium]